MKLFLAYRFSGEDKLILQEFLSRISQTIKELGHETFIFCRDRQNWGEVKMDSTEIITEALKELRQCDAILAIQNGDEKSEGLLLEVGYAKGLGKKIFLAISKDAKRPFLRGISDQVIEFNSIDDLVQKIELLF